MSLERSIRINFPLWEEEENNLPKGIESLVTKDGSEIKSRVWKGDNIRRARLCQLNIPEKFTAETLVIYPNYHSPSPIFGTEYITISNKKFFGAIDFHPLCQTEHYLETHIAKYLSDFPDRNTNSSKFYDLSKFFSPKFWIKKNESDFYVEYLDWVDRFLEKYQLNLETNQEAAGDYQKQHEEYDTHMAKNDPAHGILKAYFSKEFADFYVNKFLFDLAN